MMGCWSPQVCKNNMGTSSYTMFDDRKIQFFCDDEAQSRYDPTLEMEYPLRPVATNWWPEYQDACRSDQDCMNRSGNSAQKCTQTVWEHTKGVSGALGSACYSYDNGECDAGSQAPTFAVINDNYANTGGFSYFTQSWCTGGDMATEGS